jgi:hypothetical protein
VSCRHAPDRARARAHHQRLGRGSAAALVAHALQDVAVGDAGRREEHVLAGDEVVAVEHFGQVVAGLDGGRALLVVARPQASQQLAADALDRGRRDHALGRPPDSPQEIHRRVVADRKQRG